MTLNGSPYSSYVYDSNSNRVEQTIQGNTQSGIIYDDQDRLITFGPKSFSYNENGDLTAVSIPSASQTSSFYYDVFGNHKSVILPTKTIEYGVDAHNRRMVKKVNTLVENYFLWGKDNQLLAVMNAGGAITSSFVYGSKPHVPDYMIKDSVEYQIISNHLGSPVVVIDSSTGTIVQKITYDEFGNILSDTAPGFTPFGFAGCLYDVDTKLCRFGARDYDASIGRWLSKDPIRFEGGDTNLYGYVMQDPINFIDPDGLYAVCTRALDIPGGEALYSSNSSASHTYVKYRDGSTSSFGPKGKINEPGGGGSCSADSGSDEQEKKMKDWANNNYNKNYNLMRYNCKDFTQDVINAGRR